MSLIFHETFETLSDNLPGGWYVEYNSNLKMVPAIRSGEKCIELLSAGNKFLPVIPDVSDCKVKYTLSFNFTMTKDDFEGGFAFITAFRYDIATGRGQAVRMRRNQKNSTVLYEYGFEKRNIFTAVKSLEIPVADDETEIIVRQDDVKPCIFLRDSIHLSGLFDRYMDCIVSDFMVQIDHNRLIIWIKDGDKKWKD